MSVLNTDQYKQVLYILTFPEFNTKFIDQICTIYRQEKRSEIAQTLQIELSININTTSPHI